MMGATVGGGGGGVGNGGFLAARGPYGLNYVCAEVWIGGGGGGG